ncbi:MAG TPA: BREX system ATP-binding domain-containing protein [Kofleriaceae bacterium]|nr:BREX system ATP-binding domain-containing protein [Kofleriaceae bacterium]
MIGEGGMGVVYEAYDRERDMTVALKTVRELDAQGLYRLKTEFRARADLDHRNLVRLGELLHDDGHWFFTMELVEGWPLIDWIRNGGDADDSDEHPAFEARLRDAVRQLASGLEALHRAGKVHRDLKPSNVLVTRKGRVVVLDFGLVGEASARHRSGGHDVVGTAAYMAPEQARSPSVSPAADAYSLGVMLYEALTGRLPFDGAPLEILMRKQTEEPPPPRGPGVPADLAALCVDLLHVDPHDRPTAPAIVARLTARAQPHVEQPTPFVGRARELAQLDNALDEVAAGGTGVVFVEGESGIGKSVLVRAFVDHVQTSRPGTMVLAGRCYERESVPFKGIDGIVDALARDLLRRHPLDVALLLTNEVEALARVFPVLRRVPAIARMSVPRPASPVELRSRAFRGLRWLLGQLAAMHTVVVVIDDVQWADTDSIALLREIVHPPNAPRVLVVLTRRSDASPRPELPGPVRTISLGRLSQEEGRALIQILAPARAQEADALVDDAGGHPMFLSELVRHSEAPRATSSRFEDALWARVTRMDQRARRVLELVAVAGSPLPQGIVGQACGLDSRTLAKALDALRATSLVRTGGTRGSDPVEPYHDRVREAVVARVPRTRRRRYHERLASILIASPIAEKDPLTVVRHLEAAGATEYAADLAEQAARRAEEALAFDLAAELWAVPLRLGRPDEDRRRELLVRRAEALGYAGRGPDSAAAFLAAADGADPEAAFQCRRAAAHELLISGHIHEGLALLRQVLEEIGEHLPSSTAAAKRTLVLRWARIALRGTKFRERAPNARDSLDQLRLDVMRSASLGLSMVDVLPGAVFQARAVLVALRIGDRRRIAYALAYHAMYLAASGIRVAAARELVVQARAIAEQCRSPFLLAWARAADGVTEFFGGGHAKAYEILRDAEAQLRDRSVGTSAELNHVRNFLLFALRRMGDYDRLRERQTEYVRDALRRGDRYAATTFVWSSNCVWLAADDVARARAQLRSVSWSAREDGLHLQHWFDTRARLELALYADDVAAIDELAPAIRPFLGRAFAHVEAVATETRYLLARVAIRRGDAATARRELRGLRRVKVPYVRAFVRVAMAAAATLSGDVGQARELLAGAIADAESCQMTTLAALARRRGAELTGDATSIAEADRTLVARGIVAPARFARVFATWPTMGS